MKILITGSTGFVGKNLIPHLKSKGHELVCPSRKDLCGDIGKQTDWAPWLQARDIDVIVHLANRAHVVSEAHAGVFSLYKEINAEGTRTLAQAAVDFGVKRFIYLSSIKVHGEGASHFCSEQDSLDPSDPYGRSKLAAETYIKTIAQTQPGFEYCILRPPLVYGPGVKANFSRLVSLVKKNRPLPFRGIQNQRDIIFIGNLCSAIEQCLMHTNAKNQIFLLKDPSSVSTPQLITSIAQALGKKPRLFRVPLRLLQALGKITGRNKQLQRLTGSLTLSDHKIRTELGWEPPFSLQEGLKITFEGEKSLHE